MKTIIFFLVLITPYLTQAQDIWTPPKDSPVELGDVRWLRDYDEALKQAQLQGKSIFILFQEVPGCSTCTTYGNEVLSNPLIVEAIETHFIPLCIYNNKSGKDAQVLKKYKEPSWNNPVVRIVDKKGKDIIPRLGSSYSPGYVTEGIVSALQQMGKPIPEYLNLLSSELNNYEPEELVLSMYCFWSGEKLLGSIPGVTSTEAGFMNGHEVVKVTYDPSIINDNTLIEKAKKGQCADEVFDNNKKFKNISVRKKSKYRKDKETKYYLYHSPYKAVPMTSMQQLKANTELSRGGDITYLLSPRQLSLSAYISKKRIEYNAIGKDVRTSWDHILNM
jgi:copper chaperone CopZ/thioredoxin-related protein